MNPENGKGKIVIVSGPSGVGKSTICRTLVERIDNACLSVSMTTRKPGKGEENGVNYWFVDESEFRRRIETDELLEYAEVFGNMYGTPKDKVAESLQAGRTVILEIDVQGGKQVMAKCPDAESIFILPPNDEALAKRLNGRGRDDAEVAAARLAEAKAEIEAAEGHYRNKVINDDLDQAIERCIEIVESSKIVS